MIQKHNISLDRDKNSHQGISVVWGYPYEKQVSKVFGKCQDKGLLKINNVSFKFSGRLLNITVNLSQVCAGRKLTLGLILQEKLDDEMVTIGFKVWEGIVPGDVGTCVTNFLIKNFSFNLPEWDLCNRRKLKINVVAHYSSF
mgnify:CR=1 FL=1